MKYIEVERLRAFLQKKLESYKSKIVDPSKYPIDHIDLMALLAREYQALIFRLDSLQQEQPFLPSNLDEVAQKYAETKSPYGKNAFKAGAEWMANQMKQEQPKDLASLISEATTVAKRIVDRDSFYNSLPQNLQNKYTFNAWCEILEALSMMKEQEQPEVDLSEETITKEFHIINDRCFNEGIEGWQKEKLIARHFWNKGFNARKEK